MCITRLAPSPTGALHLGNARTFLINWLLARQNGWKILLRIEDLDGPRIKRGADQQVIEDLRWLGIDWDKGPIYQSQRIERYRAALDQLLASKRAYPCICTRKEVDAAASAPHAEDGAAVYPGTCRDRYATREDARRDSGAREPAIRFDTRGAVIDFSDSLSGNHHFNVESQLGDFVIAKGDGTPAYQLAVVVDDADMGVTNVVRGDDLIDSTPRQILLYQALGLSPRVPTYLHLPLVVAPDGRRLAKRHGDTRLATYRTAGVPASRVLSLLASWCGIDNLPEEPNIAALLDRFDLSRLPRTPIVFDPSGPAAARLESARS
ncbi:MAG: tRNA glutamyl-Q(34) synthetase GluQRS [Tepidisphaeraceae bacterium]